MGAENTPAFKGTPLHKTLPLVQYILHKMVGTYNRRQDIDNFRSGLT